MVDPAPPAPLTRAEIAKLFVTADWAAIDLYLRKVSFRILGDSEDWRADDLIQEAKTKVWAGIEKGTGRRWNPQKNALKRYLAFVLVSNFRNEAGTPYERDRVHARDGHEHVALEPTGDPYSVLLKGGRRRRGESRIERVRARLEGIERAVFDAVLAETFDPASFAAAHDLTMDEVKEARQRAKYAWNSVIESDTDRDSPGAMQAVAAAGEDVDDAPEGQPES